MTNDTNNGRDPEGYPGEKARQGKIILKHRSSRLVFIAGLILIVVFAAGAYWM